MEHPDSVETRPPPWSAIYALAVVAVLYLARPVLIPIALAILLMFVLAPLVAWIEHRAKSRVLAVAIVTALLLGAIGGMGVLVGHQVVGFVNDLPANRDKIERKIRSIREGTEGLVGRATDTIRSIGDRLDGSPPEAQSDPPAAPTTAARPPATFPTPALSGAEPPTTGDSLSLAWSVLRPIVEPLASGAIVILLLVMMLMSRESIRDRIIRLAGLNQIGLTTQTLEEAGARVSRYLRAHVLINTVHGAAIAAVLLAVGVPNAAFCGLLAGVFRFVPIVGTWIGAAIPAALSLAVFDEWYPVLIVLGAFIALEVLHNAVLEPWLYGSRTGLSSVGIVLAIVFWTWIWGAVGLVLAVPMTACLVVFARQIPHLSTLAILLGDEPVLSEPMRYYQRLLGRDEDEALTILAAAPAETEPAGVLDDIVVPSLSAARADLRRGLITQTQAARVGEVARRVALEWLADQETGPASPGQAPPQTGVVCLPVGDELDEAAGVLLAGLLQRDGVGMTVVSAGLLFSEKMAAAGEPGVNLVVVSSVEPSSGVQTRRMCKTLQRRLPEVRVVVMTWASGPPAGAAVATEDEVGVYATASTNKQAIATIKALLAAQPKAETASPNVA